MPELPEITLLARQMDASLRGRVFTGVEVLQEKCLNLPAFAFREAVVGAKILDVSNRGKWILTHTSQGWVLINLGMGGEILLTQRASLPTKHRLVLDLDQDGCISINFWWFGYVHYAAEGKLSEHEMTRKLGPNALDLSNDAFSHLLKKQRGRVKSTLLDQSVLAGIGNSYVHDILFLARLHPLRVIPSLSDLEIERLYGAIHAILEKSIQKRGAFYEMDFFGEKGGYSMEDIVIGYREGQPCPVCGTPVEKLKTGSTTGFICPTCQPL